MQISHKTDEIIEPTESTDTLTNNDNRTTTSIDNTSGNIANKHLRSNGQPAHTSSPVETYEQNGRQHNLQQTENTVTALIKAKLVKNLTAPLKTPVAQYLLTAGAELPEQPGSHKALPEQATEQPAIMHTDNNSTARHIYNNPINQHTPAANTAVLR